MVADGLEQGPPWGSSAPSPSCSRVQERPRCLTGRPRWSKCVLEVPASALGFGAVPKRHLSPPGHRWSQPTPLPGPPWGAGAGSTPRVSAEPRGARHNLSLAREVTASLASRELPARLSISALGPGTDGASCSWRRRSSLPGAEPSAWQGQPHLLGRRQKLGSLPAFAAFRLAASHGGSRRARVFAQRERR